MHTCHLHIDNAKQVIASTQTIAEGESHDRAMCEKYSLFQLRIRMPRSLQKVYF